MWNGSCLWYEDTENPDIFNITGYIDKTRSLTLYIDRQVPITSYIDKETGEIYDFESYKNGRNIKVGNYQNGRIKFIN